MINTSKENDDIRQQWREFGFYYESRDEDRLWFLAGSKEGLMNFYNILANYVKDPRYDEISEHEHHGPHMYLEIMTWATSGIDGHSIHGSKKDLMRLSEIFLSKLRETSPGHNFIIGDDYARDCEYSILVEIKENGFDPALLDI